MTDSADTWKPGDVIEDSYANPAVVISLWQMTRDLHGFEWVGGDGTRFRVAGPSQPPTYVEVDITRPDGRTERSARAAALVRQRKLGAWTPPATASSVAQPRRSRESHPAPPTTERNTMSTRVRYEPLDQGVPNTLEGVQVIKPGRSVFSHLVRDGAKRTICGLNANWTSAAPPEDGLINCPVCAEAAVKGPAAEAEPVAEPTTEEPAAADVDALLAEDADAKKAAARERRNQKAREKRAAKKAAGAPETAPEPAADPGYPANVVSISGAFDGHTVTSDADPGL